MGLTVNDDDTLERLHEHRSGQIGANCDRHNRLAGEAYKGPGQADVKSSVSLIKNLNSAL